MINMTEPDQGTPRQSPPPSKQTRRNSKSPRGSVGQQIGVQAMYGVLSFSAAFALSPSPYALIFIGVGLYFLGKAMARRRGIVVEGRAVRALKLPEGWEMHHSYPVPGLGDADLFLISPQGSRFAIEIKSHNLVTYRRSLLGSGLRFNGKKPPKCPVRQVKAVAERLNATPILWFPCVRPNSYVNYRRGKGVAICFGSKRKVLRALGLTNIFGF